ncbi:MAG: 50S ribosomal protein L1 [Candidatus Altiarchaeales archaeon]|nr:MAG: 50S ribosomal protein L1 [Candidatus Altiarchaeales archaeon]RLI94879.1 MAG: 50S ribosomal protein L1 [Candidatus Altiarchaeales archaeon]RLI94977.1 MAG: 50S ribosomal protein L1 [Candidatus Altiarchaeales archaeon]HDO82735.1 50S ribosomal protein L1 [Candidatus Altiarchaeales archaeon]HEX55384.1 50S ribosomal protein L1 [Candidatus Altiarchaeales archaeon]
MDKKNVVRSVKECLKKSKKRRFTQSIDLYINFTNIDIEKPENKLNLNILLPKGRGKEINIGVFADGDMNLRAKKLSKYVLSREELEEYARNRRKMRKFANSCYSFIAQADLMPIIGKKWGIVLAPRGKMPQPVPATADLEPIFQRLRNSIRIRSKKNPTVNAPVGTEDMNPEDIAENIIAVINAIEKQIPRDKIKSLYVKTTMGQPVEIKLD